MLLEADDCQVVLIDYQRRLMPAIHEGERLLANALRLGRIARLMGVPVWGTEQNPAGLGGNDEQIRALCQRTMSKMHFSAVPDGLVEWLRPAPVAQSGNVRSLPKHLQRNARAAQTRNTVLICGCEAHVCVLQTALDLLDVDFDVWVVTDASGSRSDLSRDAAFDRLAAAGAELVTTEMVAFEWLRSAEHEQFKPVLQIIKN